MRIRRVYWSAWNRCSMHCSFCYDFRDRTLLSPEQLEALPKKLGEIGCEQLAVCGGDPLQRPDLDVVLERFLQTGISVTVDTNAKGLRSSPITGLIGLLDYVGVPLESSDSELHDSLRGEEGHFREAEAAIRWLVDRGAPVKINTVVTRQNAASLSDLGSLINALGATRWSLYQFWPLGRGKVFRRTHEIEDTEFLAAVTRATGKSWPFAVNAERWRERKSGYLMISSGGSVYSVTEAGDDYRVLGHVSSIDWKSLVVQLSEIGEANARRLKNRNWKTGKPDGWRWLQEANSNDFRFQ